MSETSEVAAIVNAKTRARAAAEKCIEFVDKYGGRGEPFNGPWMEYDNLVQAFRRELQAVFEAARPTR